MSATRDRDASRENELGSFDPTAEGSESGCGFRQRMSCDEFSEMAEGYALSVLDAGELLACARHLAEPGPHAGCLEAVATIRGVVAELSDLLPSMRPSPAAWEGIEARLSADAERLRLERVEHQRPEAAPHQGQA
jgi:hypothetical protein